MATIKISSYEIARMFGLVYLGENDEYEDPVDCSYEYTFHGQYCCVQYGMGDDEAVDEQEAHETMGDRVLAAIGKMAAEGVVEI